MFFKLTKIINGKVIVDSINFLPVINRRKKALAASYRGQKVILKVEPAEENDEKYIKPLTDRSWAGGDYDRSKSKAKRKATKKKNRGNKPTNTD